MKTYFANTKHTVNGFNQYVVAEESLILENIRIGQGDKHVVYFAELLIYPSKNQFLFARFDKFIGFIQYNEKGLYMNLSEFIDIEDVVNLHYNFREVNWTPEQIQEFTKIAQEVMNSDYESCQIELVPLKNN